MEEMAASSNAQRPRLQENKESEKYNTTKEINLQWPTLRKWRPMNCLTKKCKISSLRSSAGYKKIQTTKQNQKNNTQMKWKYHKEPETMKKKNQVKNTVSAPKRSRVLMAELNRITSEVEYKILEITQSKKQKE